MTARAQRLARLAFAQRELARVLEAQLTAQHMRISELSSACAELEAVAAHAAGRRFYFVPSSLRKLAEAQSELERIRRIAAETRRRILTCRAREKTFGNWALLLKQAEGRKNAEEQALETAFSMAKASGKRGVLS